MCCHRPTRRLFQPNITLLLWHSPLLPVTCLQSIQAEPCILHAEWPVKTDFMLYVIGLSKLVFELYLCAMQAMPVTVLMHTKPAR